MAMMETIEKKYPEEDYSASREAETEINIENLWVKFSDKDGGAAITALQNINLEIKQGEFITLLGPSGCGKTTLLRTIADLQKPSSGKISVRGKTPREIRMQKKYGIVFQNPVLYEWRTVRRNVCMPMELMGLPKKYRTARVTEMLELVGLYAFGRSTSTSLAVACSKELESRGHWLSSPRYFLWMSLFQPLMNSQRRSCMRICCGYGAKPTRLFSL
jgi:NitT/TauT family transport system ATP-binding protein